MQCPVCQGDMWDNRQKKKNPKAPDFRCKDETCTYTLNSETGKYELGDYPTGVWIKKEVETHETHMQQESEPLQNKTLNEVTKSMLMAYAKDLIVAQINSTQYQGLGVADVLDAYTKMKKGL